MTNRRQARGTGPHDIPAEDLIGVGPGEDILIVDDSDANLIAFEAALAPLGRKLVLVQSGVEALAKLLAQDFALVILDVSMPGMSGFECAELIRQRRRSRGIPIIFVTGLSVQDTAVLTGYEVGGYDFVVKPVRAEVLRAKAHVFLQLQERTREMQRHANAVRRLEAEAHVTELHVQQQRHDAELLALRVDQLGDIDRRKDEVLALLGHQLRDPLQALQLAIDALRGLPDPSREAVERIHDVIDQRVHSLGRLLDGLLGIPLAPAACAAQRLRPARPLRVVVCDDAKDICELAADLLRADGHTVFQATSGGRAIELIESERPDVALVELLLPDVDGSTVARTVRDRLGARAPHLVAITAATAAPRPEFDEYLMKPASRERMRSVLARVPR